MNTVVDFPTAAQPAESAAIPSIQTRQIKKRIAMTIAMKQMPMREKINGRIAVPIGRRKRRAMAWAVARKSLKGNLVARVR